MIDKSKKRESQRFGTVFFVDQIRYLDDKVNKKGGSRAAHVKLAMDEYIERDKKAKTDGNLDS